MEIAILLAVVFGLSALALGFWGRSSANRNRELSAMVSKLTGERDEARGESSKAREKLGVKSAELEEAKEKLRTAKQKLHDEKDSSKRSRELDEARAEGERQAESRVQAARIELEEVRSELKIATAELETYRAGKKKTPPAKAEAPKPETVKAEAPAPEPVKEVRGEAQPSTPRAPSAEETARQESIQHQLSAARRKSEELEAEVKRVRGRAETNNRVYLVARGELEAAKDRLRTMEEKHNAVARENDVLRRALEKLQPAAPVQPAAEASPTPPAATPENLA